MPAVTQARKVLVVDDDQTLNGSLQRKFQKLGFNAEGVFDGEQAINRMGKDLFACILLDLKMPIKDGFDVLQEKDKTLNANTPTFVLTSLDEEQCRRARELGARETFDKMHMSPMQVAEEVERELVVA
ncbi:MAG: response regulator [Candidatus Peribacteraceae bacterium]|jgi:DNA-binding response OmpR family regulator